MFTSSRWLIAETEESQLQRRGERWVRGTLTLKKNIELIEAAR